MIDFEKRLKSLKARRQGTHERAAFEGLGMEALTASMDGTVQEQYEKLKETSGVRYAIGSMAPVDRKSTNVSIEEGDRVANNLIKLLNTAGISATKEIQGSVALDIHIKGHSDVDMLILKEDVILVETPKLDGTACSCNDARPMKDIIRELRLVSEDKLTTSYPRVTVDCSNNKSISLEGGSLKRKIDIVPSCWFDTHEYQRTGLQQHRGVQIYNKGNHELIGNKPFLHIHKVNEKDEHYLGNLKKVIRLMKNLVADMPDYKKKKAKKLSSYDLASIGYHMNEQLICPSYQSLALVDKLRSHLLHLESSPAYRISLWVPDESRKIFDSQDKVEALEIIAKEVSDLAESIYKELKPYAVTNYDSNTLIQKSVFL